MRLSWRVLLFNKKTCRGINTTFRQETIGFSLIPALNDIFLIAFVDERGGVTCNEETAIFPQEFCFRK